MSQILSSVHTHDAAKLLMYQMLHHCTSLSGAKHRLDFVTLIMCQNVGQAASRAADSSLLYAPSMIGSVGLMPRSQSTRCAQPKPENTTALTPCPGNVLSPTQYRPCTSQASHDCSRASFLAFTTVIHKRPSCHRDSMKSSHSVSLSHPLLVNRHTTQQHAGYC